MYEVSQDWLDNQDEKFVSESEIKLTLAVTDPDLLPDMTSITANKDEYYSNLAETIDGFDKNMQAYNTLEQNMWLLDGGREVLPSNVADVGDVGFVSSTITQSDCTFANADIPTIEIEFSQVHTNPLKGITLTWSEELEEFATSFTLTLYANGSQIYTTTITDNADVHTIYEDTHIVNFDKISISVLAWSLPYHRARISEIFLGIKKEYSKSNVTSFSQERTTNAIGETAPINNVKFSIDNSDNEYDPNNPTGLTNYLMERQQIKVKYGFKLNNEYEFIPAGIYYLSEWESPQNGLVANFVGKDLLEFMNNKQYIKGTYNANGTSLYDLAVAILTEANLPLNTDGTVRWSVDSSLQNITTTAPLPIASLTECLQYIAQAGCCIFYTDRDGQIHIEPISEVPDIEDIDYQINEFNAYSRPEITLQKPLLQTDTKIYSYYPQEEVTELYNGTLDIPNGTQKTVIITYNSPAVNVSTAITNGTIDSETYYTGACVLTITSSGDVSIVVSGNVLDQSTSDCIITNATDGETQNIDNPLITDRTMAELVGTWAKNWLSKRTLLKYNGWRADPRIDPTDVILSQNKFGIDTVRMTNIKFTYTGVYKGTGEGRII